MADSERPHLAQTDLEFLRHLKKRMLIIQLHDPHIRRVAKSMIGSVPSENNGKLIIEGSVTSTEAHDHQRRLGPRQHTGQQLQRRLQPWGRRGGPPVERRRTPIDPVIMCQVTTAAQHGLHRKVEAVRTETRNHPVEI